MSCSREAKAETETPGELVTFESGLKVCPPLQPQWKAQFYSQLRIHGAPSHPFQIITVSCQLRYSYSMSQICVNSKRSFFCRRPFVKALTLRSTSSICRVKNQDDVLRRVHPNNAALHSRTKCKAIGVSMEPYQAVDEHSPIFFEDPYLLKHDPYPHCRKP